MLSPASNDLFSFCCMRCAKKVSKLTNRPVVSLLGTRVSGTSEKMVSQGIYLKLLTPTTHNRLLRNHWDLSTHGGGEKHLPQPTHRLEEVTLRGVFFLRLKAIHLRPKNRLFNGSHYALL